MTAAAAAKRAREGNPDPLSSPDSTDPDEPMPPAPVVVPVPAPVAAATAPQAQAQAQVPAEDETPWVQRLRRIHLLPPVAVAVQHAPPLQPGQARRVWPAPRLTAEAALQLNETRGGDSDSESDPEWTTRRHQAPPDVSGPKGLVLDFFKGDKMAAQRVYDILHASGEPFERIMRISELTTPHIAATIADWWFNEYGISRMLRESAEDAERKKAEYERKPECPICAEHVDKLYSLTYTCDHACCWDCIKKHVSVTLGSTGNVVKCPMCLPNLAGASTWPEMACIPPAAVGLIDPLLFKLAAKDNPVKNDPTVARFARSRQMEAFLQVSKDDDKMSMCPKCNTWARGCVGGDTVARCPSSVCAVLYCIKCKELAHVGHTCEEASGAARAKEDVVSGAYLKKVSKACPKCSLPITHYKNHGCHHMTCSGPNCLHQFCYVCLEKWIPGGEGCDCDLMCSDHCSCLPCDECAPHHPCSACTGNCPVCTGRVPPGKY